MCFLVGCGREAHREKNVFFIQRMFFSVEYIFWTQWRILFSLFVAVLTLLWLMETYLEKILCILLNRSYNKNMSVRKKMMWQYFCILWPYELIRCTHHILYIFLSRLYRHMCAYMVKKRLLLENLDCISEWMVRWFRDKFKKNGYRVSLRGQVGHFWLLSLSHVANIFYFISGDNFYFNMFDVSIFFANIFVLFFL